MPYSRGYTVESRGLYSRWECHREGCGAHGSRRDDQHPDTAAWDAAAHQQKMHREQMLRDVMDALESAANALGPLAGSLTDLDTETYRGPACVTPQAVQSALQIWKWQVEALLPEPEARHEKTRHTVCLGLAADHVCQHSARPRTSLSWEVLVGLVSLDQHSTQE